MYFVTSLITFIATIEGESEDIFVIGSQLNTLPNVPVPARVMILYFSPKILPNFPL